MKLYNTLGRKLEAFHPLDRNNVKIYTCGPTVYARAHIGNLTSYIYWDLLIRTLEANGFRVNRVLNLTDVGHLSSDADEGEDKLEKGAKREGRSVWDIAEDYINQFLADFHSLNLLEPQKIARATDYIKQDISLIESLTAKGFTYETSDGIYYNTAKFSTYPDFAHLDLDHLRAGARVDFNSEKKNVSDFALWKFIKEGEAHAMRWDYLGRPGYPGWHIECATIIHEELGETIDIHTGGIDHIPIHHTNEIAESEAAFDKKLANFWLHCNFITIDGQKISKSLGNTSSLDDLKSRGFSPLDFKMWVLQGHYRGERNFSFDDLAAAKTRLLSWRNRLALALQESYPDHPEIIDKIKEQLSDNLNSPEAFATIDSVEQLSLHDWEDIDNLFGLNLIASVKDITAEQKALIHTREEKRQSKNYAAADQLRLDLERQGLTILDTPTGPRWQYLD